MASTDGAASKPLSRITSKSGTKPPTAPVVALSGPSPTGSQARIPYNGRSSSPGPSMDGTFDDDFESSPTLGSGALQSVAHVSVPGIPYADRYELLANSMRQHLEVTDQLLDSLVVASSASSTRGLPLAPPAASTSPTKPGLTRGLSTASLRQQTVKDSLRQSLKVLSDLTVEYQHMSLERERWLVARYQHEVDTRLLWEESMQDVAKEQADLESQLREAGEENRRHIKEIKAVRLLSPGYGASASATGLPPNSASPFGDRPDGVVAPEGGVASTLANLRAPGKDLPAVPAGADPSNPDVKIALPPAQDGVAAGYESEDEEDDDDEFCASLDQLPTPPRVIRC